MQARRSFPAVLALASLISLPVPATAQKTSPKAPATVVNPKIPRLSDVTGAGDPALVNDLRKGGFVIFFRHAATDWGQKDVSYQDFEDRSGQRNLSEAGKADAASIGKAFKDLAIPIDSIFVSPMWRCRDTAEIAFGRYEKRVELFGKVPQGPGGSAAAAEERAQNRSVRIQMLSTPPLSDMNRVLVGQQDPMIPIIPGLHRDELREGDALVIRPLGGGKFRIVAQVTPADWARLAAAYPAGK
jgi:phosphohistidine phosphatase SixA